MRLLLTDLLYAWRAALRSPWITLSIIAMLALGTGGVTAVFNPVYSTLFAPLPFPQPEQLVLIGGNIPVFNELRNRFEQEELERFFSNLTTYAPFPSTPVNMYDTGLNTNVYAVDVSEDFFETMGVMPQRGLSFKQSETKSAFVVSNRFWRNKLMGADDAIGKAMRTPMRYGTIIGVMPERFDFPAGTDIWMYNGGTGALGTQERHFIGRLRPGISMSQAAESLKAIEFQPGFGLIGKEGTLLQSLHKVLNGDRKPILLMLGSAAVLFLLLVCAGVMNVLVTQGARRQSEMAMRLILGATRRNLVFQLLREILPIVIVGACAGLWLSEIASAWLMAKFPALKGGEVAIPAKMAFFSAMVLAVTVIGGLTPALYASGVDLNTYLKSGSDVKKRFLPFSFSLRELLVGVQLSLALALLTGVGLLVSSMMFHVDVPIRWSSRDMAVVKAQFPQALGGNTSEHMTNRALFFEGLHDYLSTIPEVAESGIYSPVPFSDEAIRAFQGTRGIYKESPNLAVERVPALLAIEGNANRRGLEMLGVSLIAGRNFSSNDITTETNYRIGLWSRDVPRAELNSIVGVVIVNQSLARQFWPGENAVGKLLYNAFSNAYEVIGIVPDFYQFGDNKDFVPIVYYPADMSFLDQSFIVKLHSGALMKDFRQRLSRFDAEQVTIEVRPLGDIVSKALSNTRMTLQLLGSFALLGIIVAGLGVYATTSLMAAAWSREMGIRMAIGAQNWDILRLALWRGIRVILFGLPCGLFVAWVLSRLLANYLFQLKINDLFVWIISCALLLCMTTVAALIPAIRLTRINPMNALRE